MKSQTEKSLQKILELPAVDRINQRKEFFEIAYNGLEHLTGSIKSIVKRKVFWDVEVDSFEIDKVVNTVQMRALENLLDQLVGESRHPELMLQCDETLLSYSLKVARKENLFRNARNALTCDEVEKDQHPQPSVKQKKRDSKMRIFATPISAHQLNDDGDLEDVPENHTGFFVASTVEQETDTFLAYSALDESDRVVIILKNFLTLPITSDSVHEFEQLATYFKLLEKIPANTLDRLKAVLQLRSSSNSGVLRLTEIAQIVNRPEKELRKMLQTFEVKVA